MWTERRIFPGVMLGLCFAHLAAALELAGPFQDHAILQRDRPVFIWGTSAAGAEIVAKLGAESARSTAGKDGHWELYLPPLPAGGPHVLTVSDGLATLSRKDIFMGDVWLCSGQSNMAWPVEQSANASVEIAAARYPEIRFITIPPTKAETPSATVSGEWLSCSPETIGDCSAVAYYFARSQWEKHRVPVGLIIAPVGGSTIQPWISRDLKEDSAVAETIAKYELWSDNDEGRDIRFLQRFQEWVKVHFRADEKNLGEQRGWADVEFDDTKWPHLAMPDFLERQGIVLNGVFWLRKEIQIPPSWAGRDLTLHLGRLDDCDVTYFNGRKVGGTSLNEAIVPSLPARIYRVPGDIVQAGKAVVAIRISDYSGSGGMNPETKQLDLQLSENSAVSLRGNWKYKVETEVKGFLPPVPVRDQETSLFFNGMIAPFVGYGLRGFLWYQGESNSNDPLAYRDLFPLLIKDWRRQWKDVSLPFLFVQLAGFDPRNLRALDDPNEYTYWTYLREAQAAALAFPRTEMATAMDIGDPRDIHPPNKQEIGRRLSLGADLLVHGLPVVSSGPRFRQARVEGGKVRIEFANAENGLRADGPVTGFAVAGEDRKFYWAQAVIEGEGVEVFSPKVTRPVSVRYAWQDDPSLANLRNAEGLPAEPFRTDDWNPY